MKTIQLSIVIPVYNEKESLGELVRGLEKFLHNTYSEREYIFVDDGSSDGSFEELVSIKGRIATPMSVIRFRKNLGKSAALEVGFRMARGKKIVTMDADLQDDPREIPKLTSALDEGFDLVVGWRKDRKDTTDKIHLSRIFNNVVSAVGGISLHDMNCGLKAFRKSVIEEIHLYGELHRFIPLLVATKGFKVTEVPVVHHPRRFGDSKFGSERIVHAFFDLITAIFITSFKNRPIQLFGLAGLLCVFLGVVILTYLSYIHFLGESIGSRPLLFLGILFVLSGVQFFSTGLLGELITHIHAEKEQYPIEDIRT